MTAAFSWLYRDGAGVDCTDCGDRIAVKQRQPLSIDDAADVAMTVHRRLDCRGPESTKARQAANAKFRGSLEY